MNLKLPLSCNICAKKCAILNGVLISYFFNVSLISLVIDVILTISDMPVMLIRFCGDTIAILFINIWMFGKYSLPLYYIYKLIDYELYNDT